MKPTLIVVSGMWASGKTTLAHRLAADLGWPLIYRDGLKESFFDAVGEASQEVLDKLGPASYGIMFHICEQLLSVGVSHVLESNFNSQMASPRFWQLQEKHPVQMVQVHLRAPLETLVYRSVNRAKSGERHPVHYKEYAAVKLSDEQIQYLLQNPKLAGSPNLDPEPLNLECPLIQVDTSNFDRVNYDGLLGQLHALLES